MGPFQSSEKVIFLMGPLLSFILEILVKLASWEEFQMHPKTAIESGDKEWCPTEYERL